MSVLARPQGLPERVWSLVAGLSALGGICSRQELEAIVNPGYEREGRKVQSKPELARDTLGAASSLGLVTYDRNDARLSEELSLSTSADLSDHVHDRLCGLRSGETNSVLLEGYAWVAAQSDRSGGLGWIYESSREEFADQANQALVADEEDGRAMNTTKLLPWRRWLAFMGLGVSLPLTQGTPDLPLPSSRIVRELDRVDFPRGIETGAASFLSALAERLPYLDGGQLFTQACQRIGHPPAARRLSPLMSAALRDLHDEGLLSLRPRGDAADAARLSEDPSHLIQTFSTVIFRPAGAAG